MRRTYYDHEPAYERIRRVGGRSWDDLDEVRQGNGVAATGRDSHVALLGFLESPLCPAAGSRALDLGCGGGEGAIELARRGFGAAGVDFSPTAIVLALANAHAAGVRVEFDVGDCLDLAFEDGAFDLAIDNHTLHCLIGDDRRRFLAEAARVLRPGGVLFSETMSAEGGVDHAQLGIDAERRIDRHRTRYWTTRVELLRELANAGLEVVHIEARRQHGASPYPGDTLVTVSQRGMGRSL